ncbi:MAG: hypothetical protein RL708_2668, partial [Bacteroidota bacterium]
HKILQLNCFNLLSIYSWNSKNNNVVSVDTNHGENSIKLTTKCLVSGYYTCEVKTQSGKIFRGKLIKQ